MYQYEVICKCGHVGRKNYIPIAFPIRAENGKEAARIARSFPRVKHHQKHAILDVRRIDEKEFEELEKHNNEDGYLRCHSSLDQSLIDIEDRIIRDERFTSYEEDEPEPGYYFRKKLIRHPRRYLKNESVIDMIDEEEETSLW